MRSVSLDLVRLRARLGLTPVALTLLTFGLGYLLGPGGEKGKVTLGLATTARNIGAAATIATANFGDEPEVLITIAVCMFVVFALAFPVAKLYFHKRLAVN